jgi:hypothetical protein
MQTTAKLLFLRKCKCRKQKPLLDSLSILWNFLAFSRKIYLKIMGIVITLTVVRVKVEEKQTFLEVLKALALAPEVLQSQNPNSHSLKNNPNHNHSHNLSLNHRHNKKSKQR